MSQRQVKDEAQGNKSSRSEVEPQCSKRLMCGRDEGDGADLMTGGPYATFPRQEKLRLENSGILQSLDSLLHPFLTTS